LKSLALIPLHQAPLAGHSDRRRPTLSPVAGQPAQIQHQLGCFHEGARSGCLTMKLSVDFCLAPFILCC
jgi:hypothetical protein